MDSSLGRVLLHGQSELLQALSGFVQLAAGQDVGEPGGAHFDGHAAWVLSQEPEPPGYLRGAGGGRELAAQYLEQTGLAGAVTAHEANLVAGAQHEGRIGHDDAPSDLHAQLLGLEHLSMMASTGALALRINRRPTAARSGGPV